jgi:ribosomal peptide maturation radical SAM protein 1
MTKGVEIALINMPFAPIDMPSLGLGLLKASMNKAGLTTKVYYFSILYADLVGESIYSKISAGTHAHDLVGDWVFSNSLFQHQSALDVDRYVYEVLCSEGQGRRNACNYFPLLSKRAVQSILAARRKVDAFLDECLKIVLADHPRIVGFASVFTQQVASLSLAKRVKDRQPDLFIVFGGANCEGTMGKELVSQFTFVDAVVSGEADIVFPQMVRRVLNSQPISDLKGVYSREAKQRPMLSASVTHTDPVRDMDALPIPDYDDYFEQLEQSSLGILDKVQVLFETSRGCWWGQKHHCTFCGLNGKTMAHRSKTASRALDEIILLAKRYPGLPLRATDNILDMNYFKDLIPALAKQNLGLSIFYEVKANLKKEQVMLLAHAGIRLIQPGIESLSDQVLQTMRKGVRAIQNIQLLKWCTEAGVTPEWNLLWGFPGESPQEYHRMAEMVPLLTHLPPPNFGLIIRIDRFSPNFEQSEQLGFKNVRPYPAYSFVYPLEPAAIANLAYYFTFDYVHDQNVAHYVKPLAREVAKWQACNERSSLFWVSNPERMLIWDSRPVALNPLHILTGRERFIYRTCDEARTPGEISDLWECDSGELLAIPDIVAQLEAFVSMRIMVKQGESYLALAVSSIS